MCSSDLAFRAWPSVGQRLEIKAGGKSQTGLVPRRGRAAPESAQAEFGCVLKPNSVPRPRLRLVSHPQRMGTPEMTEIAPGSGNQSHARLHVPRPRTKAEPAPRAAASAPPRQPGAPALERNRPNAVAETPTPKAASPGQVWRRWLRFPLCFREQIKGPENAPIARFYGLCCYQSGSKKSDGFRGAGGLCKPVMAGQRRCCIRPQGGRGRAAGRLR